MTAQPAALPAPPTAINGNTRQLRVARGGGPPAPAPHRVSNGVIGMTLFIGTETMLFAGLISAFLILRAASPAWPPPGQPRLPVAVTGVNTLILLLSAWTMQRAFRSSRGSSQLALRWLAATVGLGGIFLMVQGIEWIRLMQFGLRASASQYAGTFYTLIGCHGLHVLAAVTALALVCVGIRRGGSAEHGRAAVETCRLYWFFVVAVWPILYGLVYLA